MSRRCHDCGDMFSSSDPEPRCGDCQAKLARASAGEGFLESLAEMFRVPFVERGPIPYMPNAERGEDPDAPLPYLCPLCGMRDVSERAHRFSTSADAGGDCQIINKAEVAA